MYTDYAAVYYIVDTLRNRYYNGFNQYEHWIINAFTNDIGYAVMFDDLEKAKKLCEKFQNEMTEFDGNTPLEKNRLRVVQVVLQEV